MAYFPKYIQKIKDLGVVGFEAHVFEGHVVYHGANNFTTQAPAKSNPLPIAPTANIPEFKAGLLAHQQVKTDYLTFIKMCSDCGVDKMGGFDGRNDLQVL